MIRSHGTRPSVALLALAGLALGACGTIADTDAAARVNDTVLSRSAFDELAAVTIGVEPGQSTDPITGDQPFVPFTSVQAVLNTWIVNQIIVDDLIARGETPATAESQPDPLEDLFAQQQAVFEQWAELPGATDEELRTDFDRGPSTSGVICAAHVLVETAAEAEAVVAELDGGAPFSEVAERHSVDPGSATQGGALPCTNIVEFERSYIPEFVDAALAARPGVPTAPVESSFGYHVILVPTFDQLTDPDAARATYDTPGVRFRRAATAADVRVDPRLGAFDPDSGVIPLG